MNPRHFPVKLLPGSPKFLELFLAVGVSMFSAVSTAVMGAPTIIRQAACTAQGLLAGCAIGAGFVLSSSDRPLFQLLGATCLGLSIWHVWRERRRLDQQLHTGRLAEDRWSALVAGTQDAVLVLRHRVDLFGRFMGFEIADANACAHTVYGGGGAPLQGRLVFDVLPGSWPPSFQERLDQCWQTGLRQEDEHAWTTLRADEAEPQTRWLHHQFIRLPDGVAIVSRDTTAMRHSLQAQHEQEVFYRTLVDSLPMAAFARSMRPHNRGRYVVWNQAAARIMQQPTEAVLGKLPTDVLPREVAERAEAQDVEVARQGCPVVHDNLTYTTPDGDRLVNVIKTPVYGADGALDHILTIATDVTEQRQAADELRLASRVIEEAGEAIVITDALDRVVRVNPAFLHLSGLTPSEALGHPAELLGMPPLRESHLPGIRQALHGAERWTGESQQVRADGRTLDIWLSVSTLRNVHNGITQHIRVFSDISVLKAQQRELAEQARHDVLTGLPNRRAFSERLRQAMARARRRPETLAVLFIDLDGFKAVNDALGHAAGDRLLQEVALRLQQCVRTTDCVCRLAGDEFTVILEGAGHPGEIHRIGQRIIDRVSADVTLLGQAVRVTPSIGAALLQADEDEETLCARADAAMYDAKRNGKARLVMSELPPKSDNVCCLKEAAN